MSALRSSRSGWALSAVILAALAAGPALAAPPQVRPTQPITASTPHLPPVKQQAIMHTRVTYKSKDGTDLVGYIYFPGGVLDKRLPAIVWNHGSEPDPTPDRQFRHIAEAFVPEGFVVPRPATKPPSPSAPAPRAGAATSPCASGCSPRSAPCACR